MSQQQHQEQQQQHNQQPNHHHRQMHDMIFSQQHQQQEVHQHHHHHHPIPTTTVSHPNNSTYSYPSHHIMYTTTSSPNSGSQTNNSVLSTANDDYLHPSTALLTSHHSNYHHHSPSPTSTTVPVQHHHHFSSSIPTTTTNTTTNARRPMFEDVSPSLIDVRNNSGSPLSFHDYTSTTASMHTPEPNTNGSGGHVTGNNSSLLSYPAYSISPHQQQQPHLGLAQHQTLNMNSQQHVIPTSLQHISPQTSQQHQQHLISQQPATTQQIQQQIQQYTPTNESRGTKRSFDEMFSQQFSQHQQTTQFYSNAEPAAQQTDQTVYQTYQSSPHSRQMYQSSTTPSYQLSLTSINNNGNSSTSGNISPQTRQVSPKSATSAKRQKLSSSPTQVADALKPKDFVFKGFTFQPDSNKIKFVNSEHQKDGINDGAWSQEEHDAFLQGLQECGKGRWRDIAEKYVKTRTRTQVASHAQKYFQKQKRSSKKQRTVSSSDSESPTGDES